MKDKESVEKEIKRMGEERNCMRNEVDVMGERMGREIKKCKEKYKQKIRAITNKKNEVEQDKKIF